MKKNLIKNKSNTKDTAKDIFTDNFKNKIADNPEEGIKKVRGLSRITVGIIIIAIVLILLFLILFRLNFMVGEQLRITLTPEYSEVKTMSPGNVTFKVDAKMYNKFVCEAVCTYTLSDISHSILLDNGTFSSKVYKSKSYSFDIPLDYYGYGTNIYLFRLECLNIKTALCPSNDDLLVRKSLLAVTYTPSSEQVAALDFSKKNYDIISTNAANASRFISAEEDIIKSMTSFGISFDSRGFYAMKYERDTLDDAISGLLSLWKTTDYESTKAYIIDLNLITRSEALSSDVVRYTAYLTTVIDNHNDLLSELNSIRSTLFWYRNVLSYNISTMKSSTYRSSINAMTEGDRLISAFNSPDYNYSIIYGDVMRLKSDATKLNYVLVNDTRLELSHNYPSLYVYSHILCLMGQDVINQDSNTTSNETSNISSNKNYCEHDYGIDFTELSEASKKLSDVCEYSSNIYDIVIALNNLQNDANMSDLNSTNKDSMETLLLEYKLLIDYEALANSDVNELVIGANPNFISYLNYVRNSLNNTYNVENPETLIPEYIFNSSLISFNPDNLMLSDIRALKSSCHANYDASLVTLPKLSTITATYYPLPVFDVLAKSVDINIVSPPEVVPQCCMYDRCQSCDKVSKNNPLILLHGHSFNKDTNAYLSIEIFDGFERRLSDDTMYFPTGTSIKTENTTKGILGHYYIPIVSKPTYYIETYNDLLGLTFSESKTGNIDTYALRLKESIDYTMYITGSNKVDIVAHSMGGLTVRRYMQIFGTEHVGTVILIATPNNGISDRIYALCKILGASNECDDMHNSIFLKKLNDYSDQPDIKDLYLIVGKGCDTDGWDGDGVVSLNNSLISTVPDSRVLYVNGTCSGTTVLHNELLNVDKYPEVYTFVKEKLEK